MEATLDLSSLLTVYSPSSRIVCDSLNEHIPAILRILIYHIRAIVPFARVSSSTLVASGGRPSRLYKVM